MKILQTIRDADQGNAWCADCGSDRKVEWVSINLGIIICIECSGIHRSLGTHITKVRSLTLDPHSFTQDVTELLLLMGNRVSNMIFEATLDPSIGLKPTPASTREHRLTFITAKYAEHSFVQPLSIGAQRFSTADDLLLTSIKMNDIRNALYALALKANPNVTDRSRSTHALYLALAAADPAIPSAAQAPSTPGQPRKSFPIAELLMQNGTDIPAQPPSILLSQAAKTYLEFKREQRLGPTNKIRQSEAGGSGYSYAEGNPDVGSAYIQSADVLSPLPREAESSRMRDKLVKRGSVGQRLVKSTGL
jgi:Arf-GAP/SH3 domain/ANK repeat/PH domain-containing protein